MGGMAHADDKSGVVLAGEENSRGWETLLGARRAAYYRPRFERFASGGRILSWNWPACFFSAGWFVYCRMWGHALVYALALALAFMGMGYLLDVNRSAVDFYIAVLAATAWLVLPLFANRLYFGSINRRLSRMRSSAPAAQPLSPSLPASMVKRWVRYFLIMAIGGYSVLIWLAFNVIPAFRDQEVRTQIVSVFHETASARHLIAMTIQEDKRAPRTLEEMQIGRDQWPRRAKYLDWEPDKRVLNVWLQGGLLEGGMLTLVLMEDDTWRCTARKIDRHYLPAVCKGE